MFLLVEYYLSPSRRRQEELDECLHRNLANRHIDEVLILGSPEALALLPSHSRLRKIGSQARMTFRAFFGLASTEFPERNCILANADIYFDETLEHLTSVDLSRVTFCLSRWEPDLAGVPQLCTRPDSQDAWIFRSPLEVPGADFHLGIPGCDNRVAAEIEKVTPVANPSRTIKAHHLHTSGVRTYTEAHRVRGTYKLLPIMSIDRWASP